MSVKLLNNLKMENPIKQPKTAYLTIDDSPSTSFSQKMNYLYEKKVSAIFFCIGQLLEKHPEPIIEAIQKGFPIANHSYTHPHFSNISIEQAEEEIQKTDAIIENLYQKAGVERSQKWFRFPYGDKGDKQYGRVLAQPFSIKKLWQKRDEKRRTAIQNILKKYGYSQPDFKSISYPYMRKAGLFEEADWHWTFDIMEWATFEQKPTLGVANFSKIVERLHSENPPDCRGKIGKEKRWLASNIPEIILLHDHLETDNIFNEIIDELEQLPLVFSGFENL